MTQIFGLDAHQLEQREKFVTIKEFSHFFAEFDDSKKKTKSWSSSVILALTEFYKINYC